MEHGGDLFGFGCQFGLRWLVDQADALGDVKLCSEFTGGTFGNVEISFEVWIGISLCSLNLKPKTA